jgi:MoaA/NifB/PqqE/SkfB family radical SAM enzyme
MSRIEQRHRGYSGLLSRIQSGDGMRRRAGFEGTGTLDAVEKEVLPTSYKGDSIDLYVNSTCNLKCKTCFLGNDYFKTTRNIPLGDAEKILAWAKAANVRDVAFLGGEPSLHPNISELLKLARSIGIPANRLITNGTRPFQRLLSSDAAQYIDIAYVSLDGPTAQTNDVVRGKGVFAQAKRSMALLQEHAIPFVITASITPAAYREVDSLLDLAEASGCQKLNVHWVSPTGRARRGESSVPAQAWLEVCSKIMTYQTKRGSFLVQCQAAYMSDAARGLVDQEACAVRDHANLQFMPDHSVYACGLLTDRPGLNGYRWTGDSLVVREGVTELSICQSRRLPGCPIRREVVREPFLGGQEYIPLCIYQRVNDASH